LREAWVDSHDAALGSVLRAQLTELGYAVGALDLAALARPPALVVIDAYAENLGAATDRCARVREAEDLDGVPLLLVLAADALTIGDPAPDCDELVVAPTTAGELWARIDRANRRLGVTDAGDLVRAGTVELNLATYQVRIDDVPVDFTRMEFELLRFLVTHPNRVFTRDVLLSRVWGYDFTGGTRTVDVHVRRVRAKLGDDHAQRLQTVRGVGYRFER
jgi:DNA-binding response OmpR family regulator